MTNDQYLMPSRTLANISARGALPTFCRNARNRSSASASFLGPSVSGARRATGLARRVIADGLAVLHLVQQFGEPRLGVGGLVFQDASHHF